MKNLFLSALFIFCITAHADRIVLFPEGPLDSFPANLSISPDGRVAVASTPIKFLKPNAKGKIIAWEIGSWKKLWEDNSRNLSLVSTHSSDLIFSTGQHTWGSQPYSEILDFKTGKVISKLPFPAIGPNIVAANIAADRRHLITWESNWISPKGRGPQNLKLWDVQSQTILDVTSDIGEWGSFEFLADATRFITGSYHSHADGKIFQVPEVWSFEHGKLVKIGSLPVDFSKTPYYFDLSPDRRLLVAYYANGESDLFELQSLKLIRHIPTGYKRAPEQGPSVSAVSNDGRLLVENYLGGVGVRDLQTGKVILNLTAERKDLPAYASVSIERGILAFLKDQSTLEIWDIEHVQLLKTIQIKDELFKVIFADDSTILAYTHGYSSGLPGWQLFNYR